MSAFTSADVSATRRAPSCFELLESSKFIPCAPMADPLDSGDDVSVTIKLVANKRLATNRLSDSDLR